MALIDSSLFNNQQDLKRLVEHCFLVGHGKDTIDESMKARIESTEYPIISTVRWRTTALRALGKDTFCLYIFLCTYLSIRYQKCGTNNKKKLS